MSYKWLGAVMVFVACGGFGFSIAGQYRAEIRILRQIVQMLDMMECELSYHLTPLPELCRRTADTLGGPVHSVLMQLGRELEAQVSPDVMSCMRCALARSKRLPNSAVQLFLSLGRSLGRYDLAGQLKGLSWVREECKMELEKRNRDRDQRIRGYQTLGLCAGAALAIIMI